MISRRYSLHSLGRAEDPEDAALIHQSGEYAKNAARGTLKAVHEEYKGFTSPEGKKEWYDETRNNLHHWRDNFLRNAHDQDSTYQPRDPKAAELFRKAGEDIYDAGRSARWAVNQEGQALHSSAGRDEWRRETQENFDRWRADFERQTRKQEKKVKQIPLTSGPVKVLKSQPDPVEAHSLGKDGYGNFGGNAMHVGHRLVEAGALAAGVSAAVAGLAYMGERYHDRDGNHGGGGRNEHYYSRF
ncbi:hypothetical protein JCM11641_004293 [Rhodosporidiobolus odoratus]